MGADCSRAAPQSFLADPDCTPGYYNNEGGPIGRRELRNAGRYPEGPVAYFDYIEPGELGHRRPRVRTAVRLA